MIHAVTYIGTVLDPGLLREGGGGASVHAVALMNADCGGQVSCGSGVQASMLSHPQLPLHLPGYWYSRPFQFGNGNWMLDPDGEC